MPLVMKNGDGDYIKEVIVGSVIKRGELILVWVEDITRMESSCVL